MKVILVGQSADRARLRALLNGGAEVIAEFPSMAAAREAGLAADAVMMAPAQIRQKPDMTYEVTRSRSRPTCRRYRP
jgi:hypothetical protein